MVEKVKKLWRKMGVSMVLGASALLTAASATDEVAPQTAMDIINAQTTQLKGDAVKVIAAGLGIGALFFGAKLLWSKFKGMSK